MVSEHYVCMHTFVNHLVFVEHLLGTRDDSSPWKYRGEKIKMIFVLPRNLNSVGVWTDDTQVNKDNFKYSCQE